MAQAVSKPLTKRGEYWRTHIEQWQASHTTQSQYCKAKGVSVHAFRWWRRRLCQGGQTPISRKPKRATRTVPFAEIPLDRLQEMTTGYTYEVTLPNQVQVRLQRHFDPEAVASLLSLLETSC